MEETLFITGATGFIGSFLVPELLQDKPHVRVLALVQREDLNRARRLRESLPPQDRQRFDWLIGDIRLPRLGLSTQELKVMKESVREIFHLAAFYRLDVRPETAWSVNYLGTCEVATFAAQMPHLAKFHHFSSVVAHSLEEVSLEKPDLTRERPFLNHYERSKHLAEVHVREKLVPIVSTVNIFRPGIVVGESTHGRTTKFDGLYFCLNFLVHFRRLLKLYPLYVRDADVNFPIVPVDFVAKACRWIAGQERSGVAIFPLVELEPLSWQDIYRYFFRKIVGQEPQMGLNLKTAQRLLHPRWVDRLFVRLGGLPAVSLPYVDYEIPLEMSQTLCSLKESGIEFPSFWSYADKLLDFFLANQWQKHRFLPPPEPANSKDMSLSSPWRRAPQTHYPFVES